MRNLLVTGANGFIGQSLCHALVESKHSVRGAVRSLHSSSLASGVEPVAVGNLDAATDWSSALAGVDCVIHCAARAHVMLETEADALAAYRSVNVDGSRRLAEQAVASGVRLLPVPMLLLRLAGRALGKQAEIDRLVGSLQIDSRHTRPQCQQTCL